MELSLLFNGLKLFDPSSTSCLIILSIRIYTSASLWCNGNALTMNVFKTE